MSNPQLYKWQLEEVTQRALHPRRAFFASPRTGKTLAALESLIAAGRNRVLIVAPISVCPQWAQQLAAKGYEVTRGYEIHRNDFLGALALSHNDNRPRAVVVGWRKLAAKTIEERKREKLERKKRPSRMLQALLTYACDALILDESHSMAAHTSDQSKAARKLAKAAPWLRLLTGTPSPNNYGGLFTQAMALDSRPWAEGGFGNSWSELAERFLVFDSMYPTRVIGHLDMAEFTHRLNQFVTFVRREDVFGPDQWLEDEVMVDLPPASRALYDRLAREWLIDTEATVTADHILTRMMRLQQLASGFITEDSGVDKHLHDAKIDAVMHDLEEVIESGEKAIIFHRFTWEGEEMERRAGSLGVPVFRLRGSTSARNRFNITEAMRQPGASVAVVQIQAGGVGISFSEVPYQFVLSQDYSFVTAEQAHDRTFKPHTQRFVRYYRVTDTVDITIAGFQQLKANINQAVKNMDRQQLAFGRIKMPKQQKVKTKT